MSVSVFPAAASGGPSKYEHEVVLTSTQSWTAPADVSSLEVLLCGGGGGGYYRGGGGSAGYKVITVTPATAYTITIGAGGSPDLPGSNSSFAGLMTTLGGRQGTNYTGQESLGGSGGGASEGGNIPGAGGGTGFRGYGGGGGGGYGLYSTNKVGAGTNGGGSGGINSNTAKSAVANTGSGGGGGWGNGGSGGSGICIIKYWSAT
jgi:hypothetical protein